MTSAHGLTRYKADKDACHCAECRAANAAWSRNRTRQIAYGLWKPRVDVTGTRRRLGALMRNGWPAGQLGARLGLHRNEIYRLLSRSPQVTPPTVRKVRVLYNELWDQAPPEETRWEKMAATKTREYARHHGFARPQAWDDDPGPHCIDDPAAVPATGKPPTGSPAVAAKIREARKAAGMTQRRLALVVGVDETTVQRWEQAVRVPARESWVQLELALGPLGIVRDPEPGSGEEADAAA